MKTHVGSRCSFIRVVRQARAKTGAVSHTQIIQSIIHLTGNTTKNNQKQKKHRQGKNNGKLFVMTATDRQDLAMVVCVSGV